MLRIRPYEDADQARVVALWRACGLVVPHNDPVQDIGFCRATGHGELFVGEADGRILAAVMVGHDGHRGWLYYLAVDPAHQGKDRGREMVAHAEAWLAALGVRKVQLMIRATNAAVRDFYAAIGYAEEPRIVMSRWLAERDPGAAEGSDG